MKTSELIQAIASTIESNTTLKASVLIGSSRGQANTLNDGHFSISIQSINANQYKDAASFRMEETVIIDFVKQLNMVRQFDSQVEALETEEVIISALMNQSNIPTVATFFSGISRTSNNTKEYLVVSLTFTCSYTYGV